MSNNIDALLANAQQHYLAERYPEALQDYQDAIRLNPQSAEAHYDLYLVYVKLNELSFALAELEQAARLSPGDGDIYLAMAAIYHAIGDIGKSREFRDKVSQLPGDTANRQITLGLLAANQADYQQALEHYRNVLRQQPDATQVYGYAGQVLLRLGRYMEARTALLDATRDGLARPLDLYNLAVAEKFLRNHNAAVHALERAVQKDEEYYEALLLLSSTQLRLGHWRSAWRHFVQGIKCSPQMRPQRSPGLSRP